jgi:hypothetical protein
MKTFEVQILLPRRGKSIKYIRSIEISLSEKSIDRLRIFQKDLQMSAAFCVAQIHPQVVRF